MTRRAGATIFVSILMLLPAMAEPLSLRVADVQPQFLEQLSDTVVSIVLTPESARDFARFTGENVDRQTHLRVDGKVLTSPFIREPIVGGSVYLSGIFNAEEAVELALRLRAGARLEIDLAE